MDQHICHVLKNESLFCHQYHTLKSLYKLQNDNNNFLTYQHVFVVFLNIKFLFCRYYDNLRS